VFKFFQKKNKSMDVVQFLSMNKLIVGSRQSKKVVVLSRESEGQQFSLAGTLFLPAKLVNVHFD